MKKNNLSKYLLFISIFSFAAVFFYVVQKSYDNLMSPINEVKQSIIIKPIDPTLDVAIVSEIEKRDFHDEEIVPIQVEPTPGI